jgi:hypothetical protein
VRAHGAADEHDGQCRAVQREHRVVKPPQTERHVVGQAPDPEAHLDGGHDGEDGVLHDRAAEGEQRPAVAGGPLMAADGRNDASGEHREHHPDHRGQRGGHRDGGRMVGEEGEHLGLRGAGSGKVGRPEDDVDGTDDRNEHETGETTDST